MTRAANYSVAATSLTTENPTLTAEDAEEGLRQKPALTAEDAEDAEEKQEKKAIECRKLQLADVAAQSKLAAAGHEKLPCF